MTTNTLAFQARSYAGEEDLAALADIMNICDAHDQIEESGSIDELREEYADPRFDASTHLLIWHAADGSAVGFSEYHIPRGTADELHDPGLFVYFKVVPAARGQGLEAQMLDQGKVRQRQAEREIGIPIRLEAVARDIETERAAVIEQLGFTPGRYFLRMMRPINNGLPAAEFPAGFSLRAGELSDTEYTLLRNAIWVDHFGYEPWADAEVRHFRDLSDYDPNLDLVAYDPAGHPAGFCWGSIRPEENKRNQRADGWIGMLGVRREYRGIGLGRALLREGMLRLHTTGADFARLGVDGASPTGATKLYAAEGFETVYSRTLFARS